MLVWVLVIVFNFTFVAVINLEKFRWESRSAYLFSFRSSNIWSNTDTFSSSLPSRLSSLEWLPFSSCRSCWSSLGFTVSSLLLLFPAMNTVNVVKWGTSEERIYVLFLRDIWNIFVNLILECGPPAAKFKIMINHSSAGAFFFERSRSTEFLTAKFVKQ